MSVRIKITPDQVRSTAQMFHNASSQSEDLVNKLSTQIRAMEPEWEGLTKEQFYQQFQQWQAKMKEFVVLLENINKDLGVIANRFEAADRGQAM